MAGGCAWSRRLSNRARTLRVLVRDTQRALHDVCDILHFDPEISIAVQEISNLASRTTVLVLLGTSAESRARLLHCLLGRKLLPDRPPRGCRWVRVQYGTTTQVHLTLGNSEFELVEELECNRRPWETLPVEDLIRQDQTDLATMLEVELNNSFLKDGLHILIPPDIEYDPENSDLQTLKQIHSELYSKRELILKNFNPIYLFAVDKIGKNIFSDNCVTDTIVASRSEEEFLSTFNLYYMTRSGADNGDSENCDKCEVVKDKVPWKEGRGEPAIFTSENCLDLHQVKDLNPHSQLLFVLFSDSVDREENRTERSRVNVEATESTEDTIYFAEELPESDQGFIQNLSEPDESPPPKSYSTENRRLNEKQIAFMNDLLDQWELMSSPPPKHYAKSQSLIIDDLEILRNAETSLAPYLTAAIQSANDSRSKRDGDTDRIVKSRTTLLNSVLKFAADCLQSYLLEYCTRLSEVHIKLLQHFILASFDMARELQIVPKKIQYVARQEQHLFESTDHSWSYRSRIRKHQDSTMVVTRSQGGAEEERRRIFDDPPRSPSASNATAAPLRGGDTADAPQQPAPLPAARPAPPDTRSAAVATRATEHTETTRVRTARSTKSNASAIARIRLEAEERLAAIRRKELEMEAELIKKRMAVDIAELEEDDSEKEEREEPARMERLHAWLDETAPSATNAPQEEPNAPMTAAGQVENHERVQAAEMSTPAVATRRTRFEWTPAPTASQPRKRSPTPRGRGIEQLADTLQQMMTTRPPPRQATDLPIFSGSPLEWLQFAAAMKETTRLYKFTPVENMARLRNCLRGEARDVVAPLLSTATHPDIVMKTLEQCFGRPEILVDLAFEELRRLPRMGPSATDMNAFAIKVQNVVAVLNSVEKGYLHNPLLVREVLDKVSPHVKSRWCDYAEEDTNMDAEIVKLAAFLMREADRALKHGFSVTYQPKRESPRAAASRTEATPAPRRKPVYSATAITSKSDNVIQCIVCGDSHEVINCRRFKEMNIDDRWIAVKKEGLCFKCLISRHRRFNCRARVCGTDGCRRPHHRMLHSDGRSKEAPTTAPPEEAKPETATVTSTATHCNIKLKVCPIVVSGRRGSQQTYALLDEGSTVTLMDEELAQQIGADGPATRLDIKGINSNQLMKSRRVNVSVRGVHIDNEFRIVARTMKNLDLTPQTVPAEVINLNHLRDLRSEEITFENAKPRILIGMDNWPLIVTRELRNGGMKEPAASRTELGWVIHGSTPHAAKGSHRVFHITTMEEKEDSLEELVSKHFDIDALGISTASSHVSEDDKRAKKIFDDTVAYKEGRYEVGLPWRTDDVTLPPSYNAALKRLQTLEVKLEKNSEEKLQYHAQVKNMIDKGYAELCDGSEDASPIAWYLPHFAVRNPNKPGKIRLVLDAAAKTHGTCLNDHILQGPDMLTSLVGILFRFREGIYAITADIEEMFMRVKIRKQDQPAQMFLWRERPNDPPKKYKMTSMIFGASSSPFMAHSVRNENAYRHKDTHPLALKPVTESHYMDDFVESFNELTTAREVVEQVNDVHKKADFHLRGWNSNNTQLLEITDEERRAKVATTPLGGAEKTLGLLWDATTDTLSFNTKLIRVPEAVRERRRPPTKREALSAVMSIYDPLGLLSCYTITAKITLQKLWRTKTSWDENITEEIANDFDTWLAGLEAIEQLRIPRCYDGGSEVRRRELHVFCDASEDAYATAAYWRIQTKTGEVKTILIAARAKVAPLKQQTMPRMELQAALIGARLASAIKKEHRVTIDDVTYWSDSQTVIHWLRNGSRKYSPFVAHRLGEILETTQTSEWRWVPTRLNIADVATRSGYVPKENDAWFNGPGFLRRPKSEWPQPENNNDNIEIEQIYNVTSQERNAALPDIDRFSSFDRLIGATAQVLLFIERCKDRNVKLTQEHIERATRLWIKQAQRDSFAQELENTKKGIALPKSSPLRRLSVNIEDGLLRIDGRINKASVNEASKRPIVLNGRHRLTRLIVARAHKRAGHGNLERVVNDLRQQYYITRLRPTVKAVAASCRMCRLRKTKPTCAITGDLPEERLQAFKRPFSYCGLDYFGPMNVTVGRRHEKRWGALFTCLTTRAIHLELVASLSTDSAIMALRRMAARRGWPTVIYSDNGTNFRGADVELKRAYREWTPELARAGLPYGVTWKYIAPGAPNQGGAWERLVRSVKTALAATLNEKAPRGEILATLLTEAEHSINSRPLTHVSVDPADPEALTPNHFLLGTSMGLPYTGPCDDADRKTWRAAQALADKFWRRWLREYLPTLVPRLDSNTRKKEVKVGDLVIIADPNLPRNMWPRGIVSRTLRGPDKVIRDVDVTTKGGTFRRPTSKLVVLETTTRDCLTEEATEILRRGEDVDDSHANKPSRL